MTDAPLLCPSAQPDQPDAAVFGVQTRAAAGERQVAYIPQVLPVTPELLALAGPARPAEVLRIAAPCMTSACQHFGNGACSLAARVATMLEPVVGGLPRCAIRPSCRWFREQGRAACLRCPQVVTDARPDSGLPIEVAGPGAGAVSAP
jgi:hypothetical protein